MTSTLVAARQAVDASAQRFKQARAYQAIHPHLFQQSLRHVGDDNMMVDTCNLLHCQLQAGGQPSSPETASQESPHALNTLLARFDNTPICDLHDKLFFQDGGDDDGY